MALLNWLTRFANKNNDIHHLTFSEYKNKFNNIYNIPMPYRILKINNKSKFNNLSHKDYLGSIIYF